MVSENSTHDSQHYSVLLIDSDALNRDEIANQLSNSATEKFRLTHTATINQGLSRLNSAKFDCILLDLSLADSEGLGTLRKIHQNAEDTPIVLLTTDTDLNTIEPALQAGAQDHLCKKIVNNDEILIRIIRNSIQQIALQRQLEISYTHQRHLSHYDPITGIPNRLLFLDQLNRMILESKRNNHSFALCFLSLDGFKHINEVNGHRAGDEVLISVAARLLKTKRNCDVVARLGGDEFTLLIRNTYKKRVLEKMLCKLAQEIDRPIPYGNKVCATSASIGIAIFPQDGNSADELLRNANIAMCRAKKNAVERHLFFSENLTLERQSRYEMECALIEALQPKSEQLILHFQPRVSLASNEVVGVEALVRWQHPQLGLLFPDVFVSLAMDAGLIVSLDQWVLEKVCEQICNWNANNQKVLPVSLNISRDSFIDPNFSEMLLTTLEQHKVAGKQLEIELTESALAEDIDKNIRTIKTIRAAGIKIAIDDFGSSVSSLYHLKQLQIDTLKIDGLLLKELADGKDHAFFEAIIQIGKAVGAQIVAECVETDSQLGFLKSYSSLEGQGYILGKPTEYHSHQQIRK